jgi:hypothetical protein
MRWRRRAVSARARPTQILPMRRFAAWSVRNGACGSAAGQSAGINLLAYHCTKCTHVREIAGIDRLQRHIIELLGDLERRECGQRDRRQAHEQATTDALEQNDRAALPRRPYCGAERDAQGCFPPSLSGLPGPPTMIKLDQRPRDPPGFCMLSDQETHGCGPYLFASATSGRPS